MRIAIAFSCPYSIDRDLKWTLPSHETVSSDDNRIRRKVVFDGEDDGDNDKENMDENDESDEENTDDESDAVSDSDGDGGENGGDGFNFDGDEDQPASKKSKQVSSFFIAINIKSILL